MSWQRARLRISPHKQIHLRHLQIKAGTSGSLSQMLGADFGLWVQPYRSQRRHQLKDPCSIIWYNTVWYTKVWFIVIWYSIVHAEHKDPTFWFQGPRQEGFQKPYCFWEPNVYVVFQTHPQDQMATSINWGPRVAGVPIARALLFGVYIRAVDSLKLAHNFSLLSFENSHIGLSKDRCILLKYV